MKILFVTDLIPIVEEENCAKALIPIIKELQANNEVDIVRPNFLPNSIIRGKKILKNGIYTCNNLNISNLNYFTPFWSKLTKIDVNQYDKIIAHMPSGILFVEQLLKQKLIHKPQITYAVHQSDIHVLTDFKYSIYFKNKLLNAFKNCDEVACRAPHLKEKILKLIPEIENNITIKSSKIPKELFMPENEMIEKFDDISTLNFITAANFIKRKNIDLLIKAFSLHKDKAFTLKIIGSGKEEKKLKKLCNKLNLENKIIFIGKLPQEKVFDEMKKSQIFILPSINETLGLVYLEASACGCLCIGTKNTGIDGIFQNNINSFFCDANVKGIAKVLEKTFSLTKEDFHNLLKNRSIADFKSTF